ncbi:nitrile hydratase subunit beta [Sedimentitalea todarodis]|uniref:Nitrile hydratase subunit beta n=1 Tax=Sedimentitalea todarodis TaxID=1631240 RepID=A0ABU3VF81_9RHOB|nr:nitrile hydratase subunit beta [Sedimentitalea todarodis]MDU9004836.1 nitrile hydratase subunit beta [Sedimentitalea todarodis]
MSRVHDMGGRYGTGPVNTGQPDDAPFAADWQKRAHAITTLSMPLGQWNIDMRRHARERLAPRDYARFTYYEKWIAAVTDMLVAGQVLSEAELTGDDAQPPDEAIRARKVSPEQVRAAAGKRFPYSRESDAKFKYAPGDAVRTIPRAGNRLIDGGHTRLPAYAVGAQGRILLSHGAHVFPDSNAHGLGEAPQPLYTVVFPACELWTHPEHPDDEVTLDLWECYLEPA